MRAILSFALVSFAATSGCRSGDPVTADASRDVATHELGDGVAGVYVLRSVVGTSLPAVLVSHDHYHAVITADTIFLHDDGTGAALSTKRVTEDAPERTDRDHAAFTYKVTGQRLTAEIPCLGLMLCMAPPHYTGTLSADGLELDLALNYRVPMRYAKVSGPGPVADVRVTPSSNVTIVRGGTVQLSAVALDAQGRAVANRVPLWSSLFPSVATVSANGLVRGVAEGDMSVAVFIDGRSDTVAVRVDR